MKTVCETDLCTACKACVDICPRNAVSINDNMLSNNAVIDESLCIHCGTCYKVCQVNNPVSLTEPAVWKQGWSEDDRIRSASSSGGAAAELTRAFISDGGLVCSCVFEKGRFIFRTAGTKKEAEAFSGSRYVKSDPSGAYRLVKQHLKKGRRVLFIGLPCQVAAMKKYTSDPPELYTVDLICHGSPSYKVLEVFLRQSGKNIKEINDLRFRKDTHFQLSENVNGKIRALFHENVHDKYMISFLNCFIYTQNCYSCRYACTGRVSDITVGDCWGSELPEKEKKKGISLILCQTEKGRELLDRTGMYLTDVDIEKAKANNGQLNAPSQEPKHRVRFLTELSEGRSYNGMIRKYFPKKCFKQWVKKTLLNISNIVSHRK